MQLSAGDRLAGAEWYDDEEFAAYGLSPEEIAGLRGWAQEWIDDLDSRLDCDDSYGDE